MILDGRFPTLAAALAMAFLAGWILWLGPRRTLHRAFALFLVFRSLLFLVLAFEDAPTATLSWFSAYLFIAYPFAALNFIYVFRQEHGRRRPWLRPDRGRYVRAGILLAALALETAYLLRHDWWMDVTSAGVTAGWLSLSYNATHVVFAFAALALARSAIRHPPGEQRRALGLLALGFALEPAYQGTYGVILAFQVAAPTTLQQVAMVAEFATFALVAATAATLAIGSRGPRGAAGPPATLPLLGLAAASGLAVQVLWATTSGPLTALHTYWFLDAFWVLALATLATYTTVMHRLFDLDLKAKVIFRRGTLVGMFGALIFLLGEVLEGVVPVDNTILALLSAGLITLFLRPLQHLARRLSDSAFPHVAQDDDYLRRRRAQIYRAALEGAYRDGEISTRERVVLDHLVAEMDLNPREAADLEEGIRAGLGLTGPTVTTAS